MQIYQFFKNDESERIKMLMISMGDDNIPLNILEGHSIGLRNIGNKKESMKIANFVSIQLLKTSIALLDCPVLIRIWQTSFWLGNRDEWKEQITETMNLLEGSVFKQTTYYEIDPYKI